MNKTLILEQLEKDLQTISHSPHGRRAFLALVPLILSGCATPSRGKGRYREGSNKDQKTQITVADEKKMTKEYLPQMQKDYPPYPQVFLQKYISEVGQNVVRANHLDGAPYYYNFTLVHTKAVNAFALPAGTVYVTGPLLAMASSEAELAGVIGHEIGHIQARHTAERLDKAKQEQQKSILYGLGGLLVGGALGHGLSKAICKPKDQECIERISKYGALAGAAGGLLIQKYGFMANSREDEMEADRIGFRTSVAAGYHKQHVGQFYEKLLKMEQAQKNAQGGALARFADAMSTHPPSKERVQQMQSMARKEKRESGKISSQDFKKAKQIILKYMKA